MGAGDNVLWISARKPKRMLRDSDIVLEVNMLLRLVANYARKTKIYTESSYQFDVGSNSIRTLTFTYL